MLFVSKVVDNSVYVTDTKDNVEERVTVQDICLLYKKCIKVIGTEVFDNKVQRVTQIKVGVPLSSNKLIERIKAYAKLHNPWEGLKVTEYLATARIGTVITIEYSYIGDGDRRRHCGTSVITRKDWDSWLFEDSESAFSGRTVDTSSI